MNTLKSIVIYFFNKFLYLILIVGLPSILAGFTMTGKGAFDIIMHFPQYEFTSFVDVYMAVLGRDAKWLYFQPLAFIGLALGMSLLYATIDSHMRMGDFNIRNVVRKIDYNFLPCTKFVFSIAIAGHLIIVLLSALIFLYYRIMQSTTVGWILTILTILLSGVLFLAIVTWLLLWLPTMLHTGLRDSRAFVMSSKQIGPVFIKTMSTLILPVLPYALMMVLNSCYNWVLAIVFDVLFIAFFDIWATVTMNTVYYDLNSIERADLNSMIWSKNIRS